jgi:hypothetical protein
MKKIAILAATALASTLAFAAPAAANTTETPQQRCELLVGQPNDNSTYVTTPTGLAVSTGSEFVQSRTTLSSTAAGALLRQTTPVFNGALGRNGGSPNIFGDFDSIATYSGGSSSQRVIYAQTTTTTFGCATTKVKGNGDRSTPPGLQVPYGQTIDVTSETRRETINVSNPDVDVTLTTQMVVCNSPGTKGGQWRNQNGYGGQCNTTLFNALGELAVRSNSLPPVTPLDILPDFEFSPLSNNSPNFTPVDDDTAE